MSEDWVDDENLSRDETLARFEGLSPEPTGGPPTGGLPGGGQFVTPVYTFGVVTELVERTSGVYTTPVSQNANLPSKSSDVLQDA